MTEQPRNDTPLKKMHPKDPGLEENDDAFVANRFSAINGRYVLYDQLIRNAQEQYNDYLDASDKAKELETLLREIGDIDPDEV